MKRGFTLIELLTVIAIIAILASMVMVVAPRMLERAKLRRMDGALLQIRQAMVAYYTDSDSYPPGYGFMDFRTNRDALQMGIDPASIDDEYRYHIRPYTSYIGLNGLEDVYDEFSESYDTDRAGDIRLAEFLPVGSVNVATDRYTYPTERFDGSNLGSELGRLLDAERRPFAYFPVNIRQFKKAKRWWIENGYFTGEVWNADPNDRDAIQLNFPPARYDAFVLISVGPAGRSFGVIPQPPEFVGMTSAQISEQMYHIIAMRAFFLATRDLNQNNQLDLHYDARRAQGEAALTYDVNGMPANNELPVMPRDEEFRNGYGPYLYSYGL